MVGQGRRGDHRRDQILHAALEVFAERGYRGAPLATIAQRAGLTQQGLLHYFPSKAQLLVEVLKLRDERDVEALGHSDTPMSLSALATLAEINAERRGIVQAYTVLSADSVTDGHPAGEYFQRRYQRFRKRLADTVRAECGPRLPGDLDHEQVATMVIAMMDGLQLQWLLSEDDVDMPQLFRGFLDLLRGQTDQPD